MRIIPKKHTLPLTAASIDGVSEEFCSFLESLGTPRKNLIISRLALEEILLDYQEHFGKETEFTYTESSFLGRPYVNIAVHAEEYEPLRKDDNEDDFGNRTSALIQSAESTPSFSYEHGTNSVTMKFSKKALNPIAKLFIAVGAAVLVSFLQYITPESTIAFIKDDILSPLNNTFIGMMATIELPLVFFSVACGILGIGNSTVFGKIGRRMVLYFLRVLLVMTAAAGLVFIALFRLSYGAGDHIKLHGGIELLLGVIPKSLIEPFAEGNSMQIVLLAVIIASVIVMLGDRAKRLAEFTNEANNVVVQITRILSKLLPYFVFVVLLNLIWSDELQLIITMWKPFSAFAAVLVICYLFMLLYVSFRESVSPFILAKKILPTFMIGIGTASSTALNGECSDCLSNRLGVNRRFVEFGQPVGTVVFMPSTAINFLICAVYMAYYYKVQVSLLWLIIAILLCSFVAVATPPVPGGAIAAYSVIFAQLGIPLSAVSVMISLDILFDFLCTGFDAAFLQLAMLRVADKTQMLNYDTLREAYEKKK